MTDKFIYIVNNSSVENPITLEFCEKIISNKNRNNNNTKNSCNYNNKFNNKFNKHIDKNNINKLNNIRNNKNNYYNTNNRNNYSNTNNKKNNVNNKLNYNVKIHDNKNNNSNTNNKKLDYSFTKDNYRFKLVRTEDSVYIYYNIKYNNLIEPIRLLKKVISVYAEDFIYDKIINVINKTKTLNEFNSQFNIIKFILSNIINFSDKNSFIRNYNNFINNIKN